MFFSFTFSAVIDREALFSGEVEKSHRVAPDAGDTVKEMDMDISRKLGILIFFGVPAIIGGGIIYGFAGSFTPVVVYLILLYLVGGAIVGR